MKSIGNTAALQTNLLSGDMDMAAEGGIGPTVDQVIGMQKQYPDRFTYVYRNSPNLERLDLKLDDPARVQGVADALRRKTLAQTVYDNRATVAVRGCLRSIRTTRRMWRPMPTILRRQKHCWLKRDGPLGQMVSVATPRVSGFPFVRTVAGNRLRELH